VSELTQLKPLLEKIPKQGERRENLDIAGVRVGVLHESIYFLHKAWHVAAVCSKNIDDGQLTWAEVDAYQAAMFALNATLGFLGITFPSQNALIDVWPSQSGDTKPGELSKESSEILVIGFQSLDHYMKWAILKRVLSTCSSGSLASETGEALRLIADVQFAERRNAIHYRAANWWHADLFSPFADVGYGKVATKEKLFDALQQVGDGFSVALMLAMLNLAHQMATTISAGSVTVEQELNLLGRHTKKISSLWKDCGIAVPIAA
jgi:hypothetical protein